MKRVLVVPLPEPGHILPTLNVARDLMSLGCDVVYLTAPQFREKIEASGAHFESMFPAGAVDGYLSAAHIWNQFAPETGTGLRRKRLSELIRASLKNDFVDFVLLDRVIVTNYHCSVAELLGGRDGLLFSTSLLNWQEHVGRQLEVPMLIFCPEQLEVPKFRHQCEHLQYVEPSIRPLEDETAEFDSWLDGRKPLVLVTFGSQTVLYRNIVCHYESVVELARRQTDLQFIMAVGDIQKAPSGVGLG